MLISVALMGQTRHLGPTLQKSSMADKASVSGFRRDVGRLLGPVHFTCDGWHSATSDVDLDDLPDLIDWDM